MNILGMEIKIVNWLPENHILVLGANNTPALYDGRKIYSGKLNERSAAVQTQEEVANAGDAY